MVYICTPLLHLQGLLRLPHRRLCPKMKKKLSQSSTKIFAVSDPTSSALTLKIPAPYSAGYKGTYSVQLDNAVDSEPHAQLLAKGTSTKIRKHILVDLLPAVEIMKMPGWVVGEWIGSPSCVPPVVRMEIPATQTTMAWLPRLCRTITLMATKYFRKRYRTHNEERDQICWHCEQRHYNKDLICLPARAEPNR
ncbi:uncharacterized protein BDR25DRAFT_356654 [Lindgomyces ingoldianus]|uniref:Uncharacterized protein n=1 Tax=Lindgomyces ingoldianus TaxID=673940 RepID=A0ACB6QR89_9PLEO|nr:uncharacterized protein BDR25DRAFT_356654 [Lindgomyces ingoldianus]KAF2469421.1 hypothetical protein BDR25DRAFT_356654 [Lindgomyces ingoldianus]